MECNACSASAGKQVVRARRQYTLRVVHRLTRQTSDTLVNRSNSEELYAGPTGNGRGQLDAGVHATLCAAGRAPRGPVWHPGPGGPVASQLRGARTATAVPVLPPEDIGSTSREEPACGPDMPVAPHGCAPITIPRAKASPFSNMGDPAGLRVWTPVPTQEMRRPDILRAASQGSSASGSQDTPAGVRLGTPAWTAWRRRQDLLRASSQESSTSGADTPAGPAEGMPARRVPRNLGRAMSQEGRAGRAMDVIGFAVNPGGLGTGATRNVTHAAERFGAAPDNSGQLWPARSVDSPRPPLIAVPHKALGAARLAPCGMLGRVRSEADITSATATQVVALRHSHADSHGGSGAPVSSTCP